MNKHVGRVWSFAHFCTLSNKMYGIASKIGGSSKESLYEKYAGKFYNKDLIEFK